MSDAAVKPAGGGPSAAPRCPECGVEVTPGLKYCDFCGTKVAVDAGIPAAGKSKTYSTVSGMLKGLAVVCLAIGILVFVGNRIKEQMAAPVQPPGVADGKHQAAAACEAAIRALARGPFRVIAFRSSLVAAERGGYVVSGTVELQSAAGELQRKRYFCRVHPDAQVGMVSGDARLY